MFWRKLSVSSYSVFSVEHRVQVRGKSQIVNVLELGVRSACFCGGGSLEKRKDSSCFTPRVLFYVTSLSLQVQRLTNRGETLPFPILLVDSPKVFWPFKENCVLEKIVGFFLLSFLRGT